MPNDFDFNAGDLNDPGIAPALAADLVEAMALHLAGDADVTALATGGVWIHEAPAGTAPPYLELVERDGSPEYESPAVDGTVPHTDSGAVQLSAFASTRAAARALGRAACHSLGDAALTFAEAELLQLRPGPGSTTLDPDKGPAGGDVWHFVALIESVTAGTL